MDKKVEICQIRSIDSDETLEALRDFCKKLPTEPTNGFGWPQILIRAESLENFRWGLDALQRKEKIDQVEMEEHGYVPQYYWWGYDENGELIGVAKIRPILTPVMWYNGGHVGLGVAEDSRNRGYGTLFMREIIKKCREEYGMTDVLVTIDANNLASRRVMEKCGGQMLGVIKRDGKDIVRYLISCPKEDSAAK